jgi:hypothetical protein
MDSEVIMLFHLVTTIFLFKKRQRKEITQSTLNLPLFAFPSPITRGKDG